MQQLPKTVCKTCNHPHRRDIEIDYLFKGISLGDMVKKWEIGQTALNNHFNKHVNDVYKNELYAYMRVRSAEDVVEADRVDVVATLKKLSAEAESFLQTAKDDKDVRAGITVIQELRRQLELTARIMGDLGPQKPSNILVDHPEWQKVKQVIMRVLSKHPEARAEFLREMGHVAMTQSDPKTLETSDG